MATNINFNSTLGIVKNSIVITSQGGIDPDAQAFITAAGITDATQITAVNQLVLDLKSYNIWDNLRVVYPFVGGTATSHKFNLKDPQDTDAAYRISFNGGWTHSNTGIQPNGTNAWGNTRYYPGFVPGYSITSDSVHISFYSRTDSQSGNDLGGASNNTYIRGLYFMTKYTDGTRYMNAFGSGSVLTTGYPSTTGFFVLRRDNSATTIKTSRNGVNTSIAQNLPLFGNYIAAISAINLGPGTNTRTFFSNRELAFVSMGPGLTDTQASNFNTAVQTFQTTLGRNV
jgi:hypothetical protein